MSPNPCSRRKRPIDDSDRTVSGLVSDRSPARLAAQAAQIGQRPDSKPDSNGPLLNSNPYGDRTLTGHQTRHQPDHIGDRTDTPRPRGVVLSGRAALLRPLRLWAAGCLRVGRADSQARTGRVAVADTIEERQG